MGDHQASRDNQGYCMDYSVANEDMRLVATSAPVDIDCLTVTRRVPDCKPFLVNVGKFLSAHVRHRAIRDGDSADI